VNTNGSGEFSQRFLDICRERASRSPDVPTLIDPVSLYLARVSKIDDDEELLLIGRYAPDCVAKPGCFLQLVRI
jgi:hypothetical protein